ncbi:MAG: YbgC/FadM family acyl-CoA thioesterase [bacterium]|nr:YbgC/FadM family acyl-CoA thioesterase [bacterium]
MSYIHTCEFAVRHYECDMYGHVNHANYLRYMQESAFSASAAVGFSAHRYEVLGLQWLAYETDVEYLQAARYGDVVTVKTWVADFRRVRSLRMYELFVGDKRVAQGSTDWVLLDTKAMYPTTITQEIIDAYSRGEVVSEAPRRESLPPPPKMPDGAFKLRRRVEWDDIDAAGHVNNAVYLNYVSDCGMQSGRAVGWNMAQVREMGYGQFARRHQIEYKVAALMDDELEISMWMSDIRRVSTMNYYAIRRVSDNKLIANVRTLAVWIDLTTGQPVSIPKAYLEAVSPMIVGTAGE